MDTIISNVGTSTAGASDVGASNMDGSDGVAPHGAPHDPERRARFASYDCSEACPVEAALELISGKWKGMVLYHLLEAGTLRFSELKRQMGDVTQRTLTRQLRELERDGLVARRVYPVVPPKVEYRLTAKGETLQPVIAALKCWGEGEVLDRRAAR